MVSKSSFTSKLTRDPRQRAENYASEGKKQKAAEMFARAGDYARAARFAIEAGDERLAIDCSLKAAFGNAIPVPQATRPMMPVEAAELLASRGFHNEAIGLFELGHAWRRAAASALALGQAARAGRLFERGRALFDAAEQFEAAELLDDALRVLELETRRLGRDPRESREAREAREARNVRDPLDGGPRPDGAALEQLAKVDLRRSEVLRKLGRNNEAAALLRDVRPTAQTLRLLEDRGKFREAIEAALQIGDTEAAVRLLRRAPDFDRRLAAQIYLRSGHTLEAANQFASLGMAREAAEAYESAGDWAKAGSRWETAQEHERAADAYSRARRPADAARCYAVLGKNSLAAAAYARSGDHGAAANQYLKARQPVLAATEMLAAGRTSEATKVLMQVPASSPDHELATLNLVPLLLAAGHAEDALRRLRQLPPARSGAMNERSQIVRERLYWLGRAYDETGKLDQAESCYRELADPAAEHRDALSRLSSVQERLRQAAEASRAATPPSGTGFLSSFVPTGATVYPGAPGPTGTQGFTRPTAAYAVPGGIPSNAPGGFPSHAPGGFPPNAPGGLPPNAPGGLPPNAPGGFPPNAPGGFPPNTPGGAWPPAAAPQRPGSPQSGAADEAGDANASWLDAISPPAGAGGRPPAKDLATRATGAYARAAASAAAAGASPTVPPDPSSPAPPSAAAREPARSVAGRGGNRPVETLTVGQVLAGRFEILAEVGQGGMGRVYKALDLELGDMVAIKMLLGQPDDGSVDAERLLREVQICRKITHPNVVRVFDLGRHDGWIFIIMEFLDGQGLVELIEAPARPPTAQVKTILSEIAAGLQEAHLLGVVHRDLKPENVILTANRVKILDFGIARMTGGQDKRLTQVGFAVGSPMYMSPEQIQGIPMDGRSDLYSVGVLAFALLTGGEPFDGPNPTAIAIQHLQQAPADLRVLRPDLPAGWSDLVATLLAKKPDDRFKDCQEFLNALAPLAVA